MTKADEKPHAESTVEALMLGANNNRYKLSYAAIRWAKEIKQKENLPDPVQILVPRALREILTGKVSYKEIEKLPILAKVVPPPPPTAPTITLNVSLEDTPDETEKTEKSKKKE
jgi:DNA-directed RNA polymerase subunit K/omega